MAWATKYRLEIADKWSVAWKIDIEEDAFAGTITDLIGGDEPLTFEWENSSDDVFDPIKESSAVLSMIAETDFLLADLYSIEDLQYRVKIYQNGTLYWIGYIITGNYTEPYECVPFEVTIKASCGMVQLKEILFDDDGTYYNGRLLESDIILKILGKLGYTGFTEYVNIYEESMDSTVNDSPFDQLKIDVDVFKDMYCDEVLKELLKKYNACIIHKGGEFIIYRPEELIGATVYGRVFTGIETKTSTSFTSTQYLNRTTHASVLQQVPGGALMVQRPAKKVTVNQDYGYKDSWIDNWEFKIETYDSVTSKYEGWTYSGLFTTASIDEIIAGEKSGIPLYSDVHLPAAAESISQIFGMYAKNTSDLFVFEFDYLTYNQYTAEQQVQIFIGIKSDSSNNWLKKLYNVSDATWDESANYVSVSESAAPIGVSEWKHVKVNVPGIPVDGSYTITIYTPYCLDYGLYVGFNNIQFYTSSSKILEKQLSRKLRQRIQGGYGGEYQLLKKYYTVKYKEAIETLTEYIYEKTNAINGTERDYDYILGDVLKTSTPASDADTDIDNIIEQFAGALITSIRDTLADAADAFVTAHAFDYFAGGVEVTQGTGAHTNDIIFESYTAGTDFTGSTTITNTSGGLTGTVVHTQANVTALARVDRVTKNATAEDAWIACNGHSYVAFWNTSAAQTMADFAAAAHDFGNVTLSHTAGWDYVYFTANTPGTDFAAATITAGLGTAVNVIANRMAAKRKDTITLSNTTTEGGTANILCDGVTEEVELIETIDYTTDWNTRGGSESKPLLEIIGDEIANQYSRPKQLVQMPIKETGTAISAINIVGHFQDDVNQISGNNRKFVFNRGEFAVKLRKWMIDLIEII
jgi:hypothetical protein